MESQMFVCLESGISKIDNHLSDSMTTHGEKHK